MYLSNLSVMTLKVNMATLYEHFYEAKLCYAKYICVWGEAGMLSTGKMAK